MNKFSITDLGRFSGIKPHTIRAWEQRYNTIKPGRSPGNIRSYNNEQLKRLLNIVSLLDEDRRISELSALSDEELSDLVREKAETQAAEPAPYQYHISQLVFAAVNYEEHRFTQIIGHCVLKFGFKETYSDILVPLLQRIGLMWATGGLPPAQEHFISNLIRQKIFVALDSLISRKTEGPSFMLSLPENEFHEIPLLFAHFLLRYHGQKSYYLGANVPVRSLKESIAQLNPEFLLIFLIHNDVPENVAGNIKQLSAGYKGTILVGGNEALLKQLTFRRSDRIKLISSIDEFEKFITNLCLTNERFI